MVAFIGLKVMIDNDYFSTYERMVSLNVVPVDSFTFFFVLLEYALDCKTAFFVTMHR